MKKINLKEILSKYPTFNNEGGYGKSYVLEAMKEACNRVIDLCADNADADWEPMGWLADQHVNMEFKSGEDYEVYVIKNSILKVKEMIE